jgi:probable rRNA maturation factor
VSDREILKFNRLYLNHNYVTDVIAFPSPFEKGGLRGISSHLGDIVISTDTARRQAKEQKHSLFTETKILAIHGLLHLLGYRDKKRADRDKMWKKTDQLLAQVEHL